MLDIGGGSTELVVGSGPGAAEHAISTRMGSVRLTERVLHRDPPSASEIAELTRIVGEVLADVQAAVPVDDAQWPVRYEGWSTIA